MQKEIGNNYSISKYINFTIVHLDVMVQKVCEPVRFMVRFILPVHGGGIEPPEPVNHLMTWVTFCQVLK